MREENLRTELLARRAEIVQQLDALTAQLRACDTMLAALPPATATPQPPDTPAPAVSAGAPATMVPEIPAASQPAPSKVQPPAPTMPAELLAPEMGEQPDGSFAYARWGRISIRIEHLIAEAGEHFSVNSIVEAYKVRFRWDGYPTEDSIASSFWRVVRKHGYRVLQKGSGRRPTLYTKQKAASTSAPAVHLPASLRHSLNQGKTSSANSPNAPAP